MSNNAFYVYGTVKFSFDLYWKNAGLKEKDVYLVNKGDFGALVHDCKEKPYTSKNPEEIKQMILTHNKVLDGVMEDFGGVIPLPFNTIIKRGRNSARYNLKKWLNDDQERLEKIWQKIEGKKEYGIRIYYGKDKLLKEASADKEVKKIEKSLKGKREGLSYLLQGKAKSKKQEIFQNKLQQLKEKFYQKIKRLAETKTNVSKIALDEEKDLLLSLSVLVGKEQINEIKKMLEKEEAKGFPFHLAGPFAPYSFVDNGRKQ